jgi:hypothetical protein
MMFFWKKSKQKEPEPQYGSFRIVPGNQIDSFSVEEFRISLSSGSLCWSSPYLNRDYIGDREIQKRDLGKILPFYSTSYKDCEEYILWRQKRNIEEKTEREEYQKFLDKNPARIFPRVSFKALDNPSKTL